MNLKLESIQYISPFNFSVYVNISNTYDIKNFTRLFLGTWPEGDIVVEYGKPLRIYCILNQTKVNEKYPGINASNIYFYRNEKKMPREQYLEVMNETTAMLYVDKPKPSSDMYVCKLRVKENPRKTEPVCLNSVAIGSK